MTDCTHDLDLTTMEHDEKHRILFGTIASLEPGETLRITNDHDPRPLRFRFEMEQKGTFGWEYEQEGPDRWVVVISRT